MEYVDPRVAAKRQSAVGRRPIRPPYRSDRERQGMRSRPGPARSAPASIECWSSFEMTSGGIRAPSRSHESVLISCMPRATHLLHGSRQPVFRTFDRRYRRDGSLEPVLGWRPKLHTNLYLRSPGSHCLGFSFLALLLPPESIGEGESPHSICGS